jgi:hypothetical protein
MTLTIILYLCYRGEDAILGSPGMEKPEGRWTYYIRISRLVVLAIANTVEIIVYVALFTRK